MCMGVGLSLPVELMSTLDITHGKIYQILPFLIVGIKMVDSALT